MIFSHDVEHALLSIVALVNTAPDATGHDLLPDVDALRRYVHLHSISEPGPLDGAALQAVRALRPRLRAVFVAGDAELAAARINAVVAAARVTPRLTDHDGYAWHLHYFAPGAALAEHLEVDGGMALAHVVAAGEHERLRVCDAPDCGRVLVDLSRNRSKRYCDSRTCGNRLHVAAYRERRRAAVAG